MTAPNRFHSMPAMQQLRLAEQSASDPAGVDRGVDNLVASWEMEGLEFTAEEEHALREYAHGRIGRDELGLCTGIAPRTKK